MQKFDTRNDMFESFEKGLVICELGVFEGEFSKIIYNNCEPSELYLVDMFQGYFGSGDKDGYNHHYVQLEDEYLKLIEYFKQDYSVKIFKETTTSFLNTASDNYYDVIYIDADHSYNSVLNDLKLSYNKVKTLGLISGHDYVKNTEVEKAVNQFCNEYNLKINILTNDKCPSYGIIKTI